jgi:hypothetical protein
MTPADIAEQDRKPREEVANKRAQGGEDHGIAGNL